MPLSLEQDSALNLTLSGTYGSFAVGRRDCDQTVKAEYLLTHVRLALGEGSNEALLRELVPVRELFDIQSLGFEELMQRDIDDSRVSNELIPYLLHENSPELVKLFPPVVVVVTPLQPEANRPAQYYPKVERRVEEATASRNHDLKVLQSGSTGSEAFRIDRPIINGKPVDHDLVKLRLNTNKVSLVIVDGQHRAMALLALFRNLKQDWSDARRAPFKDFYAQWSEEKIREFALEQVSLPIMFCTFPDLVEGCSYEYDVMKAARSVFLTLNKTARPVSSARNRLLDDNDLVSTFLRHTLSEIKQIPEASPNALRIHNVQLDQSFDRIKVSDPIAITGVNHVYYIIEHLFMGKPAEDVDRAVFRRTRRADRKNLKETDGLERVHAQKYLKTEQMQSVTRSIFDDATEDKLTEAFHTHIGQSIVQFFSKFEPYERHNLAVLRLQKKLEENEDPRVKPILFGGQGMEHTFESHREIIRSKVNDRSGDDVPAALRVSIDRLDGTHKAIQAATAELKSDRAADFLNDVSDKSKLRNETASYATKIISFIDELYSNLFTTVAFQAGIICTFFDAIFLCDKDYSETEVDQEFRNYIDTLNRFFIPRTTAEFKKLVEVFKGTIKGDPKNWDVVEKTPSTFRQVVFRSEMQPDQWPRYKALMLEIWNPKDKELLESVHSERDAVRKQVLEQLVSHITNEGSREMNKRTDALTKTELDRFKKQGVENYRAYLSKVATNGTPDTDTMTSWVTQVADSDKDESD